MITDTASHIKELPFTDQDMANRVAKAMLTRSSYVAEERSHSDRCPAPKSEFHCAVVICLVLVSFGGDSIHRGMLITGLISLPCGPSNFFTTVCNSRHEYGRPEDAHSHSELRKAIPGLRSAYQTVEKRRGIKSRALSRNQKHSNWGRAANRNLPRDSGIIDIIRTFFRILAIIKPISRY